MHPTPQKMQHVQREWTHVRYCFQNGVVARSVPFTLVTLGGHAPHPMYRRCTRCELGYTVGGYGQCTQCRAPGTKDPSLYCSKCHSANPQRCTQVGRPAYCIITAFAFCFLCLQSAYPQRNLRHRPLRPYRSSAHHPPLMLVQCLEKGTNAGLAFVNSRGACQRVRVGGVAGLTVLCCDPQQHRWGASGIDGPQTLWSWWCACVCGGGGDGMALIRCTW